MYYKKSIRVHLLLSVLFFSKKEEFYSHYMKDYREDTNDHNKTNPTYFLHNC